MSFFTKLKGLFGRTAEDGVGAEEAISCHDALRVVHDYLDGELEGVSREKVEAHFDACQRCYPHLRLESSFRAAVRRAAGGESAPPELRARLVDLLSEVGSEG